MTENLRLGSVFLLALIALAPSAKAQTTTGQITGVVMDSTGASVVGAKVTLPRDLTKETRDFTSDTAGRFTFTGLIPGVFSVRIEQSGFRTYERLSIAVGTEENVDLANLKLEVGQINQTVEVISDNARVEADSSTHAISLSEVQVTDMPTEGRNYLNLLRNMPGAVQTSTSDTRGWQAGGAPGINGSPGLMVVTLDGVILSANKAQEARDEFKRD